MFDKILNMYYSIIPVKYRKLSLVYLVSLVLLGIYMIAKHTGSDLFNIVDICFIKTPKPLYTFVEVVRGANYYLSNTYRRTSECFLTGWALSHIALYAIIGYNFPTMFWETFMIGILWEMAEYTNNAHDVLDVLWNSIGFFIGFMLQKHFNNT